MVVEKRVLMKVVFPKPDSPATFDSQLQSSSDIFVRVCTIMVKAAPRFATILWLRMR
jgi:hypothetical protein